jgi:hypothetical protein
VRKVTAFNEPSTGHIGANGVRKTAKCGITMTERGHRTTRRHFLVGAFASLISAPAIVQFTNLMPVRSAPLQIWTPGPKTATTLGEWYQACFFRSLDHALKSGHAMTCTQADGSLISIREAQRIVSDARAQGWLVR